MSLPDALARLDPRTLDVLRGVAIFVCAGAFLLALRTVLLQQLHRWARRTSSTLDDVIVQALRTPSLFWCAAGAIDVVLRTAPLSDEVRFVGTRALLVLVILSATLVAANIAGGLVTLVLRRQSPDASVPGLGQTVVRSVIVLLGLMVVLNALGVQIAPLLTALGVGGLAVALALQDTLSNFFAGIHILLERPFQIGDYVRLEDGQEGNVMDIGWRTTRVRTLQDDVVVVPNSKIAGSTITNFHMPIKRSRVLVSVNVTYDTDIERLRSVLLDEIAGARGEIGHILPEPAPEALLVAFGESALDVHLRFYIDDVATQARVLDVVHRRVLSRLRAEGIEMAFPTRTLHIVRGS